MLNNHAAYKYESYHKDPFVITKCWTDCTVTLQCGAINNWYNIRRIQPHNLYKNVEDVNPEDND